MTNQKPINKIDVNELPTNPNSQQIKDLRKKIHESVSQRTWPCKNNPSIIESVCHQTDKSKESFGEYTIDELEAINKWLLDHQ